MKKLSILLILITIASIIPLSACGKTEKSISEYHISCLLDGDKLTGEESVRFYNDADTSFSELKFNLFANAYRKGAKYSPIGKEYMRVAYPSGESYGEIQILSVTGGENLNYEVCGEDQNVLKVSLGEEVFPGESVTVNIKYEIKIANVIARLGINNKTINLAEFYPILCAKDKDGFYECLYYDLGDPYYSECADYYVDFSADEKYSVAHSGELVSATTHEGVARHSFKLENARSFAMVLSENFESISADVDGVTVNYYYYDDDAPLSSIEYAVKSIKTFGSLFGKYAYGVYSVVKTPFVQGGMEFPTLVMISDSVEKPSYGEVIVHETAHQWWQTAVGNNEIEYAFMDEGLAEYSTVLFYENNPEYNLNRKTLMDISDKNYKSFCTVYDKLFGDKNTTMKRSLKDFSGEYEYVNIVYIKGCIMFDEVRKCVGDEVFFTGLKNYYSDNKYKIATPIDIIYAFRSAGASAEKIIEGFINGKAII